MEAAETLGSREGWGRWKTLTLGALPFLAFVYVLWNALLLALMISLMPKNDFGRTFCSAVAFVHGEDMYQMNASIPWELREDGSTLHLWNLNPPHFHLILLPLTYLPPQAALLLWCLSGLACFLAALWIIQRELGLQLDPFHRQLALVGTIGFIGTGTALITGHLSFQLLLLVALSWVAARRGRWGWSGIFLGLGMGVKPFLFLLVPWFVWRRHWRALIAMSATIVACFALGFLVFGVDNHRSWQHKLSLAESWSWLPMNASLLGAFARTCTKNSLFLSLLTLPMTTATALWLCLVVPIGLITLAAMALDSSPQQVDRAFGLLITAALLLSPLGWTYYFWLPVGPILALAIAWRREPQPEADQGAGRWRRWLLTAAIPGLMTPLFTVNIFQPHAWATLILGNLYCWSLLFIWLALVIDALRSRRLHRDSKSFGSRENAQPCATAAATLNCS